MSHDTLFHLNFCSNVHHLTFLHVCNVWVDREGVSNIDNGDAKTERESIAFMWHWYRSLDEMKHLLSIMCGLKVISCYYTQRFLCLQYGLCNRVAHVYFNLEKLWSSITVTMQGLYPLWVCTMKVLLKLHTLNLEVPI